MLERTRFDMMRLKSYQGKATKLLEIRRESRERQSEKKSRRERETNRNGEENFKRAWVSLEKFESNESEKDEERTGFGRMTRNNESGWKSRKKEQ